LTEFDLHLSQDYLNLCIFDNLSAFLSMQIAHGNRDDTPGEPETVGEAADAAEAQFAKGTVKTHERRINLATRYGVELSSFADLTDCRGRQLFRSVLSFIL
jgi:hypothetical protein